MHYVQVYIKEFGIYAMPNHRWMQTFVRIARGSFSFLLLLLSFIFCYLRFPLHIMLWMILFVEYCELCATCFQHIWNVLYVSAKKVYVLGYACLGVNKFNLRFHFISRFRIYFHFCQNQLWLSVRCWDIWRVRLEFVKLLVCRKKSVKIEKFILKDIWRKIAEQANFAIHLFYNSLR